MGTPPERITNEAATHDAFASSAIRKAKRYVEEHYTEKISSGELARSVDLSPEHFCRMFKQATGVRLTEYVARLRVTRACEVLILRDEPISQLAFTCGFRSLAPFNKAFKKMTGMSPTEFRASRKS